MIRSSGNGGTLPGGIAQNPGQNPGQDPSRNPGRRYDARRDPRAGQDRAFEAQRGFAETWAGTGEFARRHDRAFREREPGSREGGRDGTRMTGHGEGTAPDGFRNPVSGLPQDRDRDGGDEPRRDGERVLAAIEPEGVPAPDPALAALPLRQDSAAAPTETPAAPGEAAARIEALTTRIEAALRVEIALGAAPPHVLRIPLEASTDGVGAVTVTLDAGTVEVRLLRAGGSACEVLAGAAQALAQRLAIRFPGRSVRVVEVVGLEDGRGRAPGKAAFRLSDLFGR